MADTSHDNETLESLTAKLQPVWDSLDDKERRLFLSALRLPEEGEVQPFDSGGLLGGLSLAETFVIATKGTESRLNRGPIQAGWNLAQNKKSG